MDRLTEDEANLWHAWKRATDAVRARIGAEITAATGLSDPDFAILTRLADLGDGVLRQSELAASVGWHRSRLSHQLTRMAQRDLVTRDPAGGPGVTVAITAAGRAAVDAARPVHASAVRRHLIARLPAGDPAALTALLAELADD